MRPNPVSLILLMSFLTTFGSRADDVGLLTRVYWVDPVTFVRNLNALAASGSEDIDAILKKYLSAAGVNFNGGEAVYFSDRRGQIMVRASLPELEIVEKKVALLNQGAPCLEIRTRLAEVDEPSLKRLELDWVKSANDTGLLTESKMKQTLAAIHQMAGATLSSEQDVQSWSGSRTTIGSNLLADGLTFDLTPIVLADGCSIRAFFNLKTLAFTHYGEPGKFIPSPENAAAGVPMAAAGPVPYFQVNKQNKTCRIWDGQTVVISRRAADMGLSGNKIQLIFVTMTTVDKAGKRLLRGKDLPFNRDAIPLQPARQ